MKMTYWIIAIVFAIALIAAFSYGRYHPGKDMIGELTEQVRQETAKQYEKRITELDNQLKVSQAAYIESQKRYDTIIKKLKEIKDGKDAIKPPQDATELNSRFATLGYTPTGK
jgi:DNA repair exonuclease SbcCD ATPase subunit